jgi:hypothetical protein
MTDRANRYLDELAAGLWALPSSEPAERPDEPS